MNRRGGIAVLGVRFCEDRGEHRLLKLASVLVKQFPICNVNRRARGVAKLRFARLANDGLGRLHEVPERLCQG